MLLCISTTVFADSGDSVNTTIIRNGIGLGSAIAVTISWSRNKSILLAVIHGILSWFYVIYYAAVRENE
ncbi:hypothetical protein [Chryseosolibacter indicus]|uniref:CPBP family intramembrane metalloprotease n=1 Tax=Chryseosolibacter indicus TaxID=2782351 RepID=A0ABS5VPR9_9BACT|nr:hypothetical protein [Chryseosolibacter indicus]MBT1702016.1 hypothetical protein [Chryseosolibacter indicus]